MSQVNPIIDTGFAAALAQGMGLGLHARQLEEARLYRDDQLARQNAALQDQLQRTDIMRMRAEDSALASQNKLQDRARSRDALVGVGERLYGDLNPPDDADFVEGPVQSEQSLYTPDYQRRGQDFAQDYADSPAMDRMALQREAALARKAKVAEKAQKRYQAWASGTVRDEYPGGPEAWDQEHDRRYVEAFGARDALAMQKMGAERGREQGFAAEAEALAQEFPTHAQQFHAIAAGGQSPRGLATQLRAQAAAANRKRLPTPEEAEARANSYITGLSQRMGHQPDALTVATIRDRVERGERVSADDLLSAGVDEKYVHAGLEAAQKEEATAAEKMYQRAERAYAQGLKAAGGNAAKFTGTDEGARLLADKTGALLRWSKAKAELTGLQRGRKVETPAPVAAPLPTPGLLANPAALPNPPQPPAAAPVAAPAAPPLDANLIQRLHEQNPGLDDAAILQLHDHLLQAAPAPTGGPR